MVRCMLFGMKVPLRFWPEAVQYAVHILNRSPTTILGDVTPTERWSQHKPSVDHLRVFDCVALAMIPYERRIKLDEKSIKVVMFGVSKESKAYRLYDPDNKRIIISKDVKFDEEKQWEWEEDSNDDKLIVLNDEPDEEKGDAVGETQEDVNGENEEGSETLEEEVEDVEEAGEREVGEGSNMASRSNTGKNKVRPVWMKDYVCEERGLLLIEEDGEDLVALYVSNDDLERYEDAVIHDKWRKAMEEEINSIEENHTWELVALPPGEKVIGVKWVFKTKLNEKGEVDKFKARLVAKGFLQTQGIDFLEVFAPVARWDTIRFLLGLAAQRGWSVLARCKECILT